MLQFSRCFSLSDDVFKKIPAEQLTQEAEKLNIETCKLRIVGQERDGVILLSRIAFDQDRKQKTFIDLFDIATGDLKTLYIHSVVINCVGCSVNSERTILAFTKLERRKVADRADKSPQNSPPKAIPASKQSDAAASSDDRTEEVMESSLVEIQPAGECYSLNIISRRMQRVQFLSSDPKSTHFLFILDKEFVHLYQIYTRARPTHRGVRISAQPILQLAVCRQFLWYQWEPRRDLLYLLPARKEASGEYSLRCFHFSRREKLMFELPLPLELPSWGSSVEAFLVCASDELAHVSERALAGEVNLLQVVRGTRPGMLCVCHQHANFALAPTLFVSVYVLQHRARVDFAISLEHVPAADLLSVRALFALVHESLLVYVPGHFLQLLDCADDHEPVLNLTLTGPAFAPPLPAPSKGLHVMPFDLLSSAAPFTEQMLFHCASGMAYELRIDPQTLLSLCRAPRSSSSTLNLLNAIHFAGHHLRDHTLLDKFLSELCTNAPHNLSAALLREFMVSFPYEYMSREFSGENQLQLLRVMPISTLPSLRKPITSRRTRVTPLSNYVVTMKSGRLTFASPGTASPQREPPVFQLDRPLLSSAIMGSSGGSSPSLRDSPKRDSSAPSSSGESSPATAVPTWQKLARFFMFHSEPEVVVSVGDDPRNEAFCDGLTEYLATFFPKEPKTKLSGWARQYRRCQVNYVTHVFERLLGMRSLEPLVRFELFENLYAAMEELAFPCPKEFLAEFTALGLQCLPRDIFLQYVERGVFVLSESLVRRVVFTSPLPLNDPSDSAFRVELVLRLNAPKLHMELFDKNDTFARLLMDTLLERFASLSDNYTDSYSQFSYMENFSASTFTPMSVFLDSLNTKLDADSFLVVSAQLEAIRRRLFPEIVASGSGSNASISSPAPSPGPMPISHSTS